jgi:hypothetical protein
MPRFGWVFFCWWISLSVSGQSMPSDSVPSDSGEVTLPALAAPSALSLQTPKRLYTSSAVMSGIWVGGLLTTVLLADNLNSADSPGDAAARPYQIGGGIALNTTAKVSLNGAMMNVALARYQKTKKPRTFYLATLAGASQVALRGLGLVIFNATGGAFFGGRDASDSIYIPAYSLGIVSSSIYTVWAARWAYRVRR